MTAFTQLQDSLEQVKKIADHIDSEATLALGNPDIRKRHETIQSSSIVLLSGYLESFLKQTAEEFAARINKLGRPFGSLNKKIRETHFEEGAKIAATAAKAARSPKAIWVGAATEDVVRRLHSVIGSTNYELVWEAFADTRANPGVEVVGDFLRRFGVEKPWDTLASKSGFSKTWAQTALSDLISLRNECAHTGAIAVTPLPSHLRQHCEFLLKLGKALDDVLQDHLVTL